MFGIKLTFSRKKNYRSTLKASSSGLAVSKVTGAIFVPRQEGWGGGRLISPVPRVLFVNARPYRGPLRDTP